MAAYFVEPVVLNSTSVTASSLTETTAAWAGGTTYAADAEVYRVVDGIHQKFVSLQASNTGHTPEAEPDWWADAGPTNAWAFADETVSTVSTDADEIEIEVTVPATERADVLYAAGLTGLSIRLQVEDPIAGPVFDETRNLSDPAAITDWWKFFNAALTYLDEVVFSDLPSGAGSVMTVTVANAGGTAGVGVLYPGFRVALGNARWDWTTSIRDYSGFVDDDFGNRVLIPRAYRKLASGQVLLENRVKDSVERLLASARAAVRLYIVDDAYTSLTILGTAQWAVEMSLPPSRSLCSLQLESVV